MDLSTLAATITEARVRRGWTRNRLGLEAQVTRANVYRIESGQQPPGWDILGKILVALELEIRVVKKGK
jgi:transcriptional regulator with XRE-family HTH domain